VHAGTWERGAARMTKYSVPESHSFLGQINQVSVNHNGRPGDSAQSEAVRGLSLIKPAYQGFPLPAPAAQVPCGRRSYPCLDCGEVEERGILIPISKHEKSIDAHNTALLRMQIAPLGPRSLEAGW
jgi:hypothetical protein